MSKLDNRLAALARVVKTASASMCDEAAKFLADTGAHSAIIAAVLNNQQKTMEEDRASVPGMSN